MLGSDHSTKSDRNRTRLELCFREGEGELIPEDMNQFKWLLLSYFPKLVSVLFLSIASELDW